MSDIKKVSGSEVRSRSSSISDTSNLNSRVSTSSSPVNRDTDVYTASRLSSNSDRWSSDSDENQILYSTRTRAYRSGSSNLNLVRSQSSDSEGDISANPTEVTRKAAATNNYFFPVTAFLVIFAAVGVIICFSSGDSRTSPSVSNPAPDTTLTPDTTTAKATVASAVEVSAPVADRNLEVAQADCPQIENRNDAELVENGNDAELVENGNDAELVENGNDAELVEETEAVARSANIAQSVAFISGIEQPDNEAKVIVAGALVTDELKVTQVDCSENKKGNDGANAVAQPVADEMDKDPVAAADTSNVVASNSLAKFGNGGNDTEANGYAATVAITESTGTADNSKSNSMSSQESEVAREGGAVTSSTLEVAQKDDTASDVRKSDGILRDAWDGISEFFVGNIKTIFFNPNATKVEKQHALLSLLLKGILMFSVVTFLSHMLLVGLAMPCHVFPIGSSMAAITGFFHWFDWSTDHSQLDDTSDDCSDNTTHDTVTQTHSHVQHNKHDSDGNVKSNQPTPTAPASPQQLSGAPASGIQPQYQHITDAQLKEAIQKSSQVELFGPCDVQDKIIDQNIQLTDHQQTMMGNAWAASRQEHTDSNGVWHWNKCDQANPNTPEDNQQAEADRSVNSNQPEKNIDLVNPGTWHDKHPEDRLIAVYNPKDPDNDTFHDTRSPGDVDPNLEEGKLSLGRNGTFIGSKDGEGVNVHTFRNGFHGTITAADGVKYDVDAGKNFTLEGCVDYHRSVNSNQPLE